MMSAIMEFLSADGGVKMAGGFATGCVMTWGFCQRTIIKTSKSRIDELQRTVNELKEEVKKERSMMQERLDLERKTCDTRVARLEEQVKMLQQSRFELAIDRRRNDQIDPA